MNDDPGSAGQWIQIVVLVVGTLLGFLMAGSISALVTIARMQKDGLIAPLPVLPPTAVFGAGVSLWRQDCAVVTEPADALKRPARIGLHGLDDGTQLRGFRGIQAADRTGGQGDRVKRDQ